MTLDRSDFGDFFSAVHDGHRPFPWQERLLDVVLAGEWPDEIAAPTGSGKTAVVDVHVFAQALTADDPAEGRPPRRLALVVDRRVLVDDQFEHANRIADAVRKAPDGVLADVRERLLSLHAASAEAGIDGEGGVAPLVVARLRGGVPPNRAWLDDPTAAAVVSATPDMWGSRLLFRGYGSSPRAWPREAGLLARDSVVVVDEAHLSRQLLTTARRVGELGRRVESRDVGRPVQVVAMTATPTGRGGAAAVVAGVTATVAADHDDFEHEVLRPRLARPKPVTLCRIGGWPGRSPGGRAGHARGTPADPMADVIATEVAALARMVRDDLGAGSAPVTVGCFVNDVRRAVAVAEALRPGLRVVCVNGVLRPHDLDVLRQTYPGLLTPAGHPDVDVIVTTQSLEVGVDLDLAGIVTELAPASAIAQRVGRVNRRGLRAHGPVVVVLPEDAPGPDARSGPYRGEDLAQAFEWVTRRAADPAGLSPLALGGDPPPQARPRRPLFQRPELFDAWHWARTADDLAADPDLDLWLQDDLDEERPRVSVVVRDLPHDPDEARELVQSMPPAAHEAFPVALPIATTVIGDLLSADSGDEAAGRLVLLVRQDEVTEVRVQEDDNGRVAVDPRPRPGDILVVGVGACLFTDPADYSPPVVVDPAWGVAPHALDSTRADVSEAAAGLDSWSDPTWRIGRVRLRLDLSSDGRTARLHAALREALGDADIGAGATESERDIDRDTAVRIALREWLADLANRSPMEQAVLDLVAPDSDRQAQRAVTVEVLMTPGGEGEGHDMVPRRVVVIDRRRATAEEARQVWSSSRSPVSLDAHQQAVAARAAEVGRRAGLPSPVVEALRLAGLHHDDGKADDRFQIRLGRRTADPVLAKSRPGASLTTVKRREGRAGLPAGWRHEQLSVAHWWTHVGGAASPEADARLVARLIGTSHGRGRVTFPHVTADLIGADAGSGDVVRASCELFDTGVWDELMDATTAAYGPWACAYLEALLRAADTQVSREGS